MKAFLKKILFFIVIPLALCQLLFLIVYHLISVQVDEKLDEIARSNSLLIMGDSQMQKISPDLIDSNTYNIASAGEHYFFTYSKLQKLVNTENHKIRCVVLGVSIHNFAPLFINHFDLNLSEGKGSLRRYMFFFDLFDNEFVRPQQIILNKDFFLGVLDGPEWGGHDAFFNKSPEIPYIESRLKYLYDGNPDDSMSVQQEHYLDKIVELCRQQNITLVFVSTPVHQYYKSQVDEVYYDALEKNVSNHSNLLYLNFLTDSVSSVYMSDANHLNKEGAEIYSKKISLELKKHNLTHQLATP